jgi:hypothetical protein
MICKRLFQMLWYFFACKENCIFLKRIYFLKIWGNLDYILLNVQKMVSILFIAIYIFCIWIHILKYFCVLKFIWYIWILLVMLYQIICMRKWKYVHRMISALTVYIFTFSCNSVYFILFMYVFYIHINSIWRIWKYVHIDDQSAWEYM